MPAFGHVTTVRRGPYIKLCIASNGTVYLLRANRKSIHIIKNGELSSLRLSGSMIREPRKMVCTEKYLFITDFQRHDIVRVDLATGQVRSHVGGGSKSFGYFSKKQAGNRDSSKRNALFKYPCGMDADSTGNMYIADMGNHTVRCVSKTCDVYTIAGTGAPGHRDREARFSSFSFPLGLTVGMSRCLYVTEMHGIRRIDLRSGIVSPVTGGGQERGYRDGITAYALFESPNYLCEATDGLIFVADCGNYRIRAITPDHDRVVTISGCGKRDFADGSPAKAAFRNIQDMALDHVAECLYVIDAGHLRKVSVPHLSPGTPSPEDLASKSVLINSAEILGLTRPSAKEEVEQKLKEAEVESGPTSVYGRQQMERRKVMPGYTPGPPLVSAEESTYGYVSTLRVGPYLAVAAGPDSILYLLRDNRTLEVMQPDGSTRELLLEGDRPVSVCDMVYFNGYLYMTDRAKHNLLRVDLEEGDVDVVAGNSRPGFRNGQGRHALFHAPCGLDIDRSTGILYVAGYGKNCIRTVDVLNEHEVSVLAMPREQANLGGDERESSSPSSTSGAPSEASFVSPYGVVVGGNGYLYVTEKHGVRRVDLKTGKVDPLTGARGSQRYRNGPLTEARFKDPRHLVLGPDQTLFVADCFNYRIRSVQLANEEVHTLCGSGNNQVVDGAAKRASFRWIGSLAMDTDRRLLFAIDMDGSLRQINVEKPDLPTPIIVTEPDPLPEASDHEPSHTTNEEGFLVEPDQENLTSSSRRSSVSSKPVPPDDFDRRLNASAAVAVSANDESLKKLETDLIDLFTSLSIDPCYVPPFVDEELSVADIYELPEVDICRLLPKLGPRSRLLKHIQSKQSDLYYPSKPADATTPRGIALVIGNGNAGDVRKSCHRDAATMALALKGCGYEVHHFKDLTSDEIMSRVRKVRQMDHRQYDSFVWFFSGHGTENAIYGHDKAIADSLEIHDVIDMFQPSKCRSLEAKPKIFLWDCCRGERTDKGNGSEAFSAPQYLDFLYGYAAASSFRSYIGDHASTGGMSIWTYFLTKRIAENKRRLHFADLLTICQNDVQAFVRAQRGDKKQASNHLSFLTKFMYVG